MNIKCDYVLLCENVVVDEYGKTTIINAFNSVFAPELPTVQPKLFFLTSLIVQDYKSGDDVDMQLTVNTPAKVEILKAPVKIKFAKDNVKRDKQTNVIALDISMMPITEYGNYVFSLKMGDKKVASRELEVQQGGMEDARKQRLDK